MPDYSNTGKSASDAYEVRQVQGSDNYDPHSTMGGVREASMNADTDVQARELAENEVVKSARRKIMEILAEDEPPARAPQGSATGHVRRRNNPGLSMEDLAEGLSSDDLAALGGGINDAAGAAALDLFQSGYMGDGDEAAELAESMAARPQAPAQPSWDWVTVKKAATLRGGKTVPVWMVENTKTGMGMNKPFRVQAPAERIASLLNVTGNVNDPRIGQIHEDYDKYVSLSKQLRQAKKLYESGDQNAKRTGARVSAELRGVKQRLGI